ncbi:MAG: oligosaccharide flippase family protein [Phycisphaerae bacterium]
MITLYKQVSWSVLAVATNILTQITATVVLVRLLQPTDFGVITIAFLLLRFVGYFAELGMLQTLVQWSDLQPRQLHTAFTVSLLLSGLFLLVIVVGAPYAVIFIDHPQLAVVTIMLAAGFIIQSLSLPALVILQRDLCYRVISVSEMIACAVGFLLVAIPLAALGFGVWSLVAGALMQLTVGLVIRYAWTRHTWRLAFDLGFIRHLFRFGGTLSLLGFLQFLTQSADQFLVGRYLGGGSLGVYNRSLTLVNGPLNALSAAIVRVLFPHLARQQHDRPAFAQILTRQIGLLALLLFPLGGLALGWGIIAVPLLLGLAWTSGTGVFMAYAALLPILGTISLLGTALTALGALRGWLVVEAVFLTITVCALIYILRPYGMVAGAWTVVLIQAFRGLVFLGMLQLAHGIILSTTLRYLGLALQSALIPSALGMLSCWLLGTHGWLIVPAFIFPLLGMWLFVRLWAHRAYSELLNEVSGIATNLPNVVRVFLARGFGVTVVNV